MGRQPHRPPAQSSWARGMGPGAESRVWWQQAGLVVMKMQGQQGLWDRGGPPGALPTGSTHQGQLKTWQGCQANPRLSMTWGRGGMILRLKSGV